LSPEFMAVPENVIGRADPFEFVSCVT
jgi:hypothetical protein